MDSPAGYIVFRQAIPKRFVVKALAAAGSLKKKDWDQIFLTIQPPVMDTKRHQYPFAMAFVMEHSEWLGAINKIVMKKGKEVNKAYEMRCPWVYIRSLPGGKVQQVHRDFGDGEVPHYEYYQASAIVALQDNTKISTFGWEGRFARLDEEDVVELDAGDLIIFRGDLIHRGLAYDEVNIRLHCFLDLRGQEVEEDSTQPVHIAQYRCFRCMMVSFDMKRDMEEHKKTCFKCAPCAFPSAPDASRGTYNKHNERNHSALPLSKKMKTN